MRHVAYAYFPGARRLALIRVNGRLVSPLLRVHLGGLVGKSDARPLFSRIGSVSG